MPARSSGSVSMNQKALFWLGIVAVIVYGIYSFLPASSSVHKHSHSTWKSRSFVPISEQVKARIEKVGITSSDITFTVKKDKCKVFYRESKPYDKSVTAPKVVLIHGAGDSSKWWEDIGTIQLLSAAGYHVYAIDLPGFGKTETTEVKDPGYFLASFFEELQIVRPVIIAASLGGAYGLPYLMDKNPSQCETRAAGFIPIAIVGTENYKPPQYHRCNIPTMIVYGTKDKKLGLYSVGDLRNMANSEIFPMEKAGHACVRERPDEWHKLLYNYLIQAVPRAN